MPNPELILIALLILAALAYMARKYRGAAGCGSRGKPKSVSLTIGGEPVRKR